MLLKDNGTVKCQQLPPSEQEGFSSSSWEVVSLFNNATVGVCVCMCVMAAGELL